MNLEPARISVVMATFNRAAFLPLALGSVLAQTVPVHEIVVVDDGSTDDTAAVIAGYGTRVRYLHQGNRGRAAALNAGIAMATGDFVWLLDDDDEALPDASRFFLARLQEHPDAAWVYAEWFEGVTGTSGAIVPRTARPLPREADADFLPTLLWRCFVQQQAAVISTAAIRAVGPLRTDLTRSQDYELWIRLARRFRGVPLYEKVFVRRMHEGVRGTAAAPISGSSVTRGWAEFDQRIFRDVYADLGLVEYLPVGERQRLPAEARQAALVRRAGVMASKGLWDLFAQDLSTICREAGERRPSLSDSDTRALFRAMDVNYWEAFAPLGSDPDGVPSLRRACRGPTGEAILLALAKGAYFQARSYVREREWRRAATCLALSARLLSRRSPRPRRGPVAAPIAGRGADREEGS